MSKLAAANHARLQRLLDQKWRDSSGEIFTFREHLQAGRFCAKRYVQVTIPEDKSSFFRCDHKPGRMEHECRFYYDQDTFIEVPKLIFDYADLPVLPSKAVTYYR